MKVPIRNFRTLLAAILACAALGGGGLLTRTLVGQSAAQEITEEFQRDVLPVLSKSCLGCHSDRLRTGNFSLEPFQEPGRAPQTPEMWQKVLDKVVAGQMPPRPLAPLSASELAAVTGWIRKLPGIVPAEAGAPLAEASANPGRVTARRLNRAEYNNTIRDLLGVSLRPADEFPVDDSGYGFDNIGDVLTLSHCVVAVSEMRSQGCTSA